jgi:hypothetical protein
MTLYTPAPWYVDGFRIRAECNDVLVADVSGPDRRARGKEWREDMDYCMGNARLAAAAPELLEALLAAVECGMVPISSAKDGGASAHSIQVRVADQIRAAIAKVMGEVE